MARSALFVYNCERLHVVNGRGRALARSREAMQERLLHQLMEETTRGDPDECQQAILRDGAQVICKAAYPQQLARQRKRRIMDQIDGIGGIAEKKQAFAPLEKILQKEISAAGHDQKTRRT